MTHTVAQIKYSNTERKVGLGVGRETRIDWTKARPELTSSKC